MSKENAKHADDYCVLGKLGRSWAWTLVLPNASYANSAIPPWISPILATAGEDIWEISSSLHSFYVYLEFFGEKHLPHSHLFPNLVSVWKQYFTRPNYVSFGYICTWLLVPLGERSGGNYTYNKLCIYVPYKEWGRKGRTPEYKYILPQLRIRNSSICLTDFFHGWTIFRNQNFSAGCAHGCRGIIACWHAQ